MQQDASARADEPTDTGTVELSGLFPRGEGAVSTSRSTASALVIHPSVILAILAGLSSLVGAGMSLVFGRALMVPAVIGWVLAGPVAAILMVFSRRMNLMRSASARFAPSVVAERIHVVALILMLLATVVTAVMLGPWVARW